MRITCPLCGVRPLEEFVYRGDATKSRPDADALMEDWVGYVYLRNNPKGLHQEHWRHAYGCGAWLVVQRDTVSHQIDRVELARNAGGVP